MSFGPMIPFINTGTLSQPKLMHKGIDNKWRDVTDVGPKVTKVAVEACLNKLVKFIKIYILYYVYMHYIFGFCN